MGAGGVPIGVSWLSIFFIIVVVFVYEVDANPVETGANLCNELDDGFLVFVIVG